MKDIKEMIQEIMTKKNQNKAAQVENEIAGAETATVTNVSTGRAQDYITLGDYKAISYEQYKEQCKMKCRLKEWAEMVYFRVPKVAEIVNEMLKLGIYLKRDGGKGKYIMQPIVGAEHWTLEQWQEYMATLAKDNELMSAIEEMLSRLSTVVQKPMYSKSCSMKPCFRIARKKALENSCYLSDCKYAAEKFEELTRRQYDRLLKESEA